MSSRVKMTSAAPPKNSVALSTSSLVSQKRQGFALALDQSPIYYRLAGTPAPGRPVVVLLDGIGCDGYIWKYLEPELGADHLVVHMHYRGHGRTPAPRDRMRVDIVDLADDLEQVLAEAVGPDAPVFLMGHSMGVQVALEYYRRYRARVAGLCLLCGSYGTPLRTFKGTTTLEQLLPFVQVAAGFIPGIVSSVWKTVIPTELSFQIATRFEINGELISREDFFPYLTHMAQVDTRLFLTMLAAAGRHSAQELLEQVAVPTLIVAGDRDGFTPPELSTEMHTKIQDSELYVIEQGSHSAPIERPTEVTQTIAEFIRRRVAAASAS